MRRRSLGLAAVIFAIAAAPALAGPTVTVRVEGQNATLLAPTTVTLGSDPVALAQGGPCPGNSAAAALDKATNGNWDRNAFTSTILGESHTFTANDYWAEWVSNHFGGGICSDLLNDGDVLLMIADVSDASFHPTVLPLVLAGVPTQVAPGAPFTVTVTEYGSDGSIGSGTAEPAAGVGVGGATTGADGRATITLSAPGPTTLRAVRGAARSAPVPVCVSTGSDGACGQTAASACATTGDDGLCGTKDKRAPRGRIASIGEGQRFANGKGPRTLSGTVAADPSGIADVRLRLTRNDHGRCQTFDGRSERLLAMKRCGAQRGKWFSAGDRQQWSYLLPARLGPGRYVLDVEARDGAGNVDSLLQRTRTRVVFFVS
jgi:hypothetical protein